MLPPRVCSTCRSFFFSSFLILHNVFLYRATKVRISNWINFISEKWVWRENVSLSHLHIRLLKLIALKICLGLKKKKKKALFMEKSVIPRRAIAQPEMTKPFLIHDGCLFFFGLNEKCCVCSLSSLERHYYRTDGKITAIKVPKGGVGGMMWVLLQLPSLRILLK